MTDTSAVDMLTNEDGSIVDRDGTSSGGSVEIIDDVVLGTYLRVTRSQIFASEKFSLTSSNYDFNAYHSILLLSFVGWKMR